ncbi:hypothetical protein M747DRAFT_16226 [Aspergillus niger ATCC 13496]|uniref:Uncharacterized protein n=1 Tax=Aspergillus niger ATCC 13496 TaxID=1353008 RepID=A0A370C5J7_ASPNG|nr:hypothetical protein M747DRAFT_16226 [Aspergillus niger ATCC 13496]
MPYGSLAYPSSLYFSFHFSSLLFFFFGRPITHSMGLMTDSMTCWSFTCMHMSEHGGFLMSFPHFVSCICIRAVLLGCRAFIMYTFFSSLWFKVRRLVSIWNSGMSRRRPEFQWRFCFDLGFVKLCSLLCLFIFLSAEDKRWQESWQSVLVQTYP